MAAAVPSEITRAAELMSLTDCRVAPGAARRPLRGRMTTPQFRTDHRVTPSESGSRVDYIYCYECYLLLQCDE